MGNDRCRYERNDLPCLAVACLSSGSRFSQRRYWDAWMRSGIPHALLESRGTNKSGNRGHLRGRCGNKCKATASPTIEPAQSILTVESRSLSLYRLPVDKSNHALLKCLAFSTLDGQHAGFPAKLEHLDYISETIRDRFFLLRHGFAHSSINQEEDPLGAFINIPICHKYITYKGIYKATPNANALRLLFPHVAPCAVAGHCQMTG